MARGLIRSISLVALPIALAVPAGCTLKEDRTVLVQKTLETRRLPLDSAREASVDQDGCIVGDIHRVAQSVLSFARALAPGQPGELSFEVGEAAEVKAASGFSQGCWIPCSITGSGDVQYTYNIHVALAPEGQQDIPDVPVQALRKATWGSEVFEAIQHADENPEKAFMAYIVAREAARRAQAAEAEAARRRQAAEEEARRLAQEQAGRDAKLEAEWRAEEEDKLQSAWEAQRQAQAHVVQDELARAAERRQRNPEWLDDAASTRQAVQQEAAGAPDARAGRSAGRQPATRRTASAARAKRSSQPRPMHADASKPARGDQAREKLKHVQGAQRSASEKAHGASRERKVAPAPDRVRGDPAKERPERVQSGKRSAVKKVHDVLPENRGTLASDESVGVS